MSIGFSLAIAILASTASASEGATVHPEKPTIYHLQAMQSLCVADMEKEKDNNPNVFARYYGKDHACTYVINAGNAPRDMLADAYTRRCEVRYHLLDMDDARADCDTAIAFAPKNGFAYFWRSVVRRWLQDERGAEMDYNTALRLDTHKTVALATHAGLRAERRAKAADLFRRCAKQSEPAAQVAQCTDAIRAGELANLNTARPLASRCNAYLETQQLDLAERDCDQAVVRAPDSDTVMLQGRIRLAKGNFRGALEAFDRIGQSEFAPIALEGYRDQATAGLAGPARHVKSYVLGDPSCRLKPGESENRSKVRCLRGRIAKDSRDDESRMSLVSLLGEGGRHAEAVAQLNILAKRNPKNASILTARCFERFVWRKQLRAALADCDKSLAIQPADPSALDTRGSIKLRLRMYTAAEEDFSNAIKLAPNCARCLYGRSLARQKLKKTDEARADAETAIKLNPFIDRLFWSPRAPNDLE